MCLLTVFFFIGMLEKLTSLMIESTDWSQAAGGKVKLLKVITEPFTKNVIQVRRNLALLCISWPRNTVFR